MKRIIFLAFLVAALPAAFSCRTVQTAAALNGFRWRPVALYGEAVAPATEAFVVFSAGDGRVGGNGGCNLFGGAFHIAPGGVVRFSDMVFTRRMCFGTDVESSFAAAFEAAVRYVVRGRTLRLFDDADVEVATLVKAN